MRHKISWPPPLTINSFSITNRIESFALLFVVNEGAAQDGNWSRFKGNELFVLVHNPDHRFSIFNLDKFHQHRYPVFNIESIPIMSLYLLDSIP